MARTNQKDTIKNNHLLLKTEILFPLIAIFDIDSNYIMYGASVEYKLPTKFGIQLNTYWHHGDDEYHKYNGYFLMPEGRYYIKNHFLGIYGKYEYSERIEYDYETTIIILASGILYGYQLEFGKLNLEGVINVGIAKPYFQNRKAVGDEDDLYIDFFLGIRAGWRIF